MEGNPADQDALVQWKLVRSAIEHENTLISHRVTWFLATQLFLFAGFSSIFVKAVENDSLFGSAKVYSAFVVISCIGIWICILAWANMRIAGKMIGRFRDWWVENHHSKNEGFVAWRQSVQFSGAKNLPPVNGIFTDRLVDYFGEKRLPITLAMFWLLLLSVTTSVFIQRRLKEDANCVLVVLALIALASLVLLYFRQEEVKKYLKDDSKGLKQELIDLYNKIQKNY
jgi:hypothetical protein